MPPEYGRQPPPPVPCTRSPPAEKHGLLVRAPRITTAQDTVLPPPHRDFHSSCPPTPKFPCLALPRPARARHPSPNWPAIASRALCLCAPAIMTPPCCFHGKSHFLFQSNYASDPFPFTVPFPSWPHACEYPCPQIAHAFCFCGAFCGQVQTNLYCLLFRAWIYSKFSDFFQHVKGMHFLSARLSIITILY